MKKNDSLAPDFVTELLSIALSKRSIFDIVRAYMKYSFFQKEEEKKLWQYIVQTYEKTGKISTIGQLQQHFNEEEKVLDKIEEIKNVEIDENLKNEKAILDTFENFIKKMKFLEANDEIADYYNQGKKEQAWNMFVKYAEEFSKFSISSAKFETVFGDFSQRQARRKSDDWNFRFKVPTGIDELDYRLGGASGGPETGECVLWLGDSGVGKSQALIQIAISAARQGHRVAHFQLEGTREQCLNRFDAAWTGTLYQDMKMGNISEDKLDISRRIISKLYKNDIIVSSEESFSGKTLSDVRRELKDMENKFGKIDVINIDYLELLEVGDGHNYTPGEERFRQTKLARGMKMLAMEYNAVVHVATQSNNIPEEQKNDPDFVITRAQLSEDKGKIRPFDIFVTMNQTHDEMKEQIMRLNTDKLRDYRNGDPIKIANNFAYSRFYDRKRTMSDDFEE